MKNPKGINLNANNLLSGPLTNEQKRQREKAASEFNMWFLLERQERYPYYFDPHTKTIQVIGSWHINMASHRHLYLQRQHDIQNLQQQLAKQQASRQKDMVKQQIALQQRTKQIEELKDKAPKPKSNITAFFHYLNENREIEKRGQPDISLADISRLLGSKWKGLSEEDKKPYLQRAIDDKKRFETEFAEYNQRIKDLVDNLPPIDISTIPDPEEPAPPVVTPPQPAATIQASTAPPLDIKKSAITATCESCNQVENKDQLLSCISCLRSYHGKCLQLHPLAIETIRKSGTWKCTDCKLCESCKDPGQEEKMLFCDVCDKGFHTFCLNPSLEKPPVGGWRCPTCVFCVHCGSKSPGTKPDAKWRGNYTSCESCTLIINDRKSLIDPDEEEEEEEEEEAPAPPSNKRRSTLAAEERISKTRAVVDRKRKKREPAEQSDHVDHDDVNVDD
eukprot:gene14987-17723_t